MRVFMLRSFTDRFLGGVCGGLAVTLRLNSWLLRALFVVLTLASAGAFAVLYVVLWWITPQERLLAERRGGLPVLLVLLLVVLTAALWAVRDQGMLIAPNGTSLYFPILALVLSVVFFLRQVRA
jgi:phage shock protein PspC (stress-responsive transcriptional regulator)